MARQGTIALERYKGWIGFRLALSPGGNEGRYVNNWRDYFLAGSYSISIIFTITEDISNIKNHFNKNVNYINVSSSVRFFKLKQVEEYKGIIYARSPIKFIRIHGRSKHGNDRNTLYSSS
jgi:hypothetical protein